MLRQLRGRPYFRVLKNWVIASRSCFSICFHFHLGACSDFSERATMGCNSGGASCNSQMCIRMWVASVNKFVSPASALFAASVARTSRASSLGIGVLTPISRKAESISSCRILRVRDSPVQTVYAPHGHRTHVLELRCRCRKLPVLQVAKVILNRKCFRIEIGRGLFHVAHCTRNWCFCSNVWVQRGFECNLDLS